MEHYLHTEHYLRGIASITPSDGTLFAVMAPKTTSKRGVLEHYLRSCPLEPPENEAKWNTICGGSAFWGVLSGLGVCVNQLVSKLAIT